MQERISQATLYKAQPAIAESLIGLGQAAIDSGLEKSLIHLVKLRASQINGCAFCQHMHLEEARKDKEAQTRLDLLAVWHEVTIFSAREAAALQWTEALTSIAGRGVSEDAYTRVSAHFNAEEVINLTAAVIAINSWNRIAVAFHFQPNIS